MQKYDIAFTGKCTVEANSEEEAKRLFDRHIDPSTGILTDREFSITAITPRMTYDEYLQRIADILYETWRYR